MTAVPTTAKSTVTPTAINCVPTSPRFPLEFDCGPSVNTLKRFELDGNSNRFIRSGDAFEPRLLSAIGAYEQRRAGTTEPLHSAVMRLSAKTMRPSARELPFLRVSPRPAECRLACLAFFPLNSVEKSPQYALANSVECDRREPGGPKAVSEKEDQRRRDIKNHLPGRRHSAQSSRSANRSPALQQTLRPRPGPASRMFLDCTELHKASHVVGRRHSGRRALT